MKELDATIKTLKSKKSPGLDRVIMSCTVAYPYATTVREEPNGDLCTGLLASHICSHILFSHLF